ncbi:2-keto-4-pentenoate hydratase [Clostridiales bacterium PH28_bin88]|nr:2-keto-4-pentenoate hydratase [Clostridiales bacterium PH28_bin88]
MLGEDKYQQLAGRLLVAERTREPITALTDEFKDITIDDAYQVQLKVIKAKVNEKNPVVGKKIGLTSLAMQNLLGVYEPDYGHLLSNIEVVDGGVIRLGDLMQPKVEAEVAFLLKKDLSGPGVSVSDVLRATEAVVPSLEIVDSRVKDWKIKIQDTIADNASSARFVLGGRLTPLDNLDLTLTGLVFKRNGEVLSTAAGAAVLGHPAAAVAWLANKLAEFEITLKAGEVVLSGAFTAAVAPVAGDYFEACFDRLGTASVRFAG